MPSWRGPNAVLVDTNILLRIAQFENQQDMALMTAIEFHRSHGSTLCITFQNIAEFWNVATRQEIHRGFGLPIREVALEVDDLLQRFTILAETPKTVSYWRKIVEDQNVKGVLVHDARLAAVMLEYEIDRVLTLNLKDFARFPFITPVDPREPI